MLVEKYDGSLKAEHGTGRNMAPSSSWNGAPRPMAHVKEIKVLFDPKARSTRRDHQRRPCGPPQAPRLCPPLGQLYAPVDRKVASSAASEPQCPSHGLTPVARASASSLARAVAPPVAGEAPGQLGEDYLYMGLDTCATWVAVSTGSPGGHRDRRSRDSAPRVARTFSGVVRQLGKLAAGSLAPPRPWPALRSPGIWLKLPSGPRPSGGSPASGRKGMPMPRALTYRATRSDGDKVVYFPTCAGWMFGADTLRARAVGHRHPRC